MSFDLAIAETICGRLSTEPVSLATVLKEAGQSTATFYRWMRDNPQLREDYARAREAQGDVDADAIAEVRQQMLDGKYTPEQARVAIDSLKWSAGKRKPKVYGDKLQLDADVRMQVELVDATAVQAVATLITKEDPSTER
jgi:hypothetical protein